MVPVKSPSGVITNGILSTLFPGYYQKSLEKSLVESNSGQLTIFYSGVQGKNWGFLIRAKILCRQGDLTTLCFGLIQSVRPGWNSPLTLSLSKGRRVEAHCKPIQKALRQAQGERKLQYSGYWTENAVLSLLGVLGSDRANPWIFESYVQNHQELVVNKQNRPAKTRRINGLTRPYENKVLYLQVHLKCYYLK